MSANKILPFFSKKNLFKHLFSIYGLFVFIALAFGVGFSVKTPPLWGVDEISHFLRAYTLADGHVNLYKLPDGSYGGDIPIEVVNLTIITTRDLRNNGIGEDSHVDDAKTYSAAVSLPPGRETPWTVLGSGAYSPVAYVVPAVGIFAARVARLDVGGMLLLARLSTLAAYTVTVAGALYIMRSSKYKWIIFTCALLPMSVFQASIVNVDSLAIALSFLLFAQVLGLKSQKKEIKNLHLGILSATCIALGLSKPNYYPLVLSVLIIPSALLSKRQNIYTKIALPIIAFLPLAIWFAMTAHIVSAGAAAQRGTNINLDAGAQLTEVIKNPVRFIYITFQTALKRNWFAQMYGTLGFNFITLPPVVISLASMTVILATLSDNVVTPLRKRIDEVYLAVLGLSVIASIIGIFYLTFTAVGENVIEGVQGRYFIPVLPFILLLLRLLPIDVKIPLKHQVWFFSMCATIALSLSAYWYFLFTY
jgi:uncharacterized membrane protein